MSVESNNNLSKLRVILFKSEEFRERQLEQIRDRIVLSIFERAHSLTLKVVKNQANEQWNWDRKIDDLLTSRIWGYPIMLFLLGAVFWITITGANYPSALLAKWFFALENKLLFFCQQSGFPEWFSGIFISGMYKTTAWVVSVMLPPMAIFFPLFTLLEDLGYLPRVAFNLDKFFKKAGAHGKQALTMAMGFGCNAAGIVACRIIESPRERMIAILTNNFVPCNGRFPTLFSLATIFVALLPLKGGTALASGLVVAMILLGIVITLLVSWLLSKTILKGIPSSFTLELPPYRPPQVGKIIVRSIFDRVIFVLGRAVAVAAPAGVLVWILANVQLGGASLIAQIARFFTPLGELIGLDGFILTAFLLGLPANEIVIPILIMSYLAESRMLELDSIESLKMLFLANGWTPLTAFNMILFSLLHFPCSTTLWTIKKETGSRKWMLAAALIPTAVAIIVCLLIAGGVRLAGFV